MENFYVYTHYRPDKNEIFYVGIAKRTKYQINKNLYSRAYEKVHSRNPHWKNVIAINNDYVVNIVFESSSVEEIKKKEIELIKLYGRRDLGLGSLVNMTDGGDGLINPSDETKSKISKANKGNTHSQETKKRWSKNRTGEGNPMYGRNFKSVWEQKYSEKESNILYEKWKKNVGASSKGRVPINKNKKLSESDILKIKKGIEKNRKVCEYCCKITDSANFSKWHGENCTKKQVIKNKSQILELYANGNNIYQISKKLNLRYSNVKFIIDENKKNT